MQSTACIALTVVLAGVLVLLLFASIEAHLIWTSLRTLGKRVSASLGSAKGAGAGLLDSDFHIATDAAARAAAGVALRILGVVDDLHKATVSSQPRGKGETIITPDAQDIGSWRIIGTTELPYFCAVGVWNHHVCVVFRGTSDHDELLHNDFGMQFIAEHGTSAIKRLVKSGVPLPYPPQTTLTGLALPGEADPKVNSAFYYSYAGSIDDDVREALQQKYAGQKTGATLPLVVGGHSLGAGVACICALLLSRDHTIPKDTERHLVAAAVPKPGDSTFRQCLLRSQTSCICFANEMDIIPWSPAGVIPDFTAAEGVLQYALAPGTWTFSYEAKALTECHSIEAYKVGIRSVQYGKSPSPGGPSHWR